MSGEHWIKRTPSRMLPVRLPFDRSARPVGVPRAAVGVGLHPVRPVHSARSASRTRPWVVDSPSLLVACWGGRSALHWLH